MIFKGSTSLFCIFIKIELIYRYPKLKQIEICYSDMDCGHSVTELDIDFFEKWLISCKKQDPNMFSYMDSRLALQQGSSSIVDTCTCEAFIYFYNIGSIARLVDDSDLKVELKNETRDCLSIPKKDRKRFERWLALCKNK